MDPLHVAHLSFVLVWAGLVLAESVIELSARDDESRRHAARLHYWIDVTLELPLLALVLGTGIVLVSRKWPPEGLLLVKVLAGLFAIAANLVCAVMVVVRQRRADDVEELRKWSARVLLAWTAIPVGLAAFVIGIGWFRG